MAVPKVPFWVGVVIAGVIGILAQPWSLFDVLVNALLIIGGILTAIVGILYADYYLIRKRRINVKDLYELNGQFKYMNGFNLAGLIAWVIGGVIANIFSAYSSLVGFIVGALVYYVLAKYWWFKKYPQAELEDPSDAKYLGITAGHNLDELFGQDLVPQPAVGSDEVEAVDQTEPLLEIKGAD